MTDLEAHHSWQLYRKNNLKAIIHFPPPKARAAL